MTLEVGPECRFFHCPLFQTGTRIKVRVSFYVEPSMTQDALVARILTQTKVIALVGWSPKPDRASHSVAATFTPVPGWRRRAATLEIVAQYPWPWLRRPTGRSSSGCG